MTTCTIALVMLVVVAALEVVAIWLLFCVYRNHRDEGAAIADAWASALDLAKVTARRLDVYEERLSRLERHQQAG